MWYTSSVFNINNYCIWVACVVVMWWCGVVLRFYQVWACHIPHQFKLSLQSNSYYLYRSSQVNVGKTFTLPVSHHIFYCWHILNIINSVSDECLKVLVGLPGRVGFCIVKIPWSKLLEKEKIIFFLRLSGYYFFIM